MGYLIRPFKNDSLEGALKRVRIAHDFLVRSVTTYTLASQNLDLWGIFTKRNGIALVGSNRPPDIEKDREGLGELVHMIATVERLIAALDWFSKQTEFAQAVVAECHPTTSDTPTANDLVLADLSGKRVALVEVCDVVSSTAMETRRSHRLSENLAAGLVFL